MIKRLICLFRGHIKEEKRFDAKHIKEKKVYQQWVKYLICPRCGAKL